MQILHKEFCFDVLNYRCVYLLHRTVYYTLKMDMFIEKCLPIRTVYLIVILKVEPWISSFNGKMDWKMEWIL